MKHRILARIATGPLLALGLAASASAQPSDFEVSLERGACFGTCPDYVVTIHRDGLVEFEGGRFTKAHGHKTRKIPEEAIRRLFAEFEAAQFFRLAPSYRGGISDQATVV